MRIFNLAKDLAGIGHDVRVIVPTMSMISEEVEGVEVRGLKGFLPEAALRVLRRFVNIGRPTALYFYDFLFLLRLTPFIREADVVQIEQQSSGGLLIPFVRAFLKKPIVVDCHDVFQSLRLRNTSLVRRILETFLEKNVYRYADLVLTVSEVEKKYLVSSHFENKKIEVIPNGVDTQLFRLVPQSDEIRKRYGLEGSRVVTFVGNLDYDPNREAVEVLSSEIAPKILNHIKNVKFLIIGKMQNELHLERLTFAGFVQDLPRVLSISNVAVAPLVRGSGTRLKILEYFSIGLPVVSTSIGAEGLDIEDGVNIFIEDNFDRFASRVVTLLEDSHLSDAVGKAACVLARTVYDWQSITRKLDATLAELCSRNS